MAKELFEIKHVPRKVLGTPFLKNVTYVFRMSEFVMEDAKLGEYASHLKQKGYDAMLNYDEGGVLVAKTKGIQILCNRDIFLLNVFADDYKNFDAFKSTLCELFHDYSSIVKAKAIEMAHVMKRNEFVLNRLDPKLSVVSKERFEKAICSSTFLDAADNGFVQQELKGVGLFAKRSIFETDKSYTLELIVSATKIEKIPMDLIDSRLVELNDAIYDMWNTVLSDAIKKAVDTHENK